MGHPLRDLFHEQPNVTVHETAVTDRPRRREGAVRGDGTARRTTTSVLALGARVEFFGVEGAEHAFPMYTLADAVRLREHVLQKWEAADRDPGLVDDGALNIVIVGGGPTGVESAGALAELYRSNFAKDYPGIPQDKARIVLVEGGPPLFSMFKPDIRTTRKRRWRSVAWRSPGRGRRVDRAETCHAQVGTVLKAHTLVWGAGLQANPSATHSVSICRGAAASPPSPT